MTLRISADQRVNAFKRELEKTTIDTNKRVCFSTTAFVYLSHPT